MTTEAPAFRILIIDDEEEFAAKLAIRLEAPVSGLPPVKCDIETSFDRGEQLLMTKSFDLVVLDVKDNSAGGPAVAAAERGREVYKRIMIQRWVPVVFWTGVPKQVQHLAQPPLIQVVRKNALPEIVDAVRTGLESGVPALTRRLEGMLSQEIRSFLRDVVAPKWSEMADADHQEIGPLLVNRLAAWLKEHGVAALRTEAPVETSADSTSAACVYLYPRVASHITTGDLIQDPQERWWLVLTPVCDMVQVPGTNRAIPKAEYVKLARADVAHESPVIAKWINAGGNKDSAMAVYRPNHNRFLPLPKYLVIPDLVVDFEHIQSVKWVELDTWMPRATLDSPFVEAALAAHSRSVGRIGTPDIPTTDIRAELMARQKEASQAAVPAARTP
ncbi:hypothetical protein [Kitasatospora sp. GP82]|uniref:hypothetical protein n=1 Tax=Kitasatospora sp. GP82 TaxID=3035089 RepID=UPI0024747CB3|nr:hypothetical protein [Kitasatospora sp. GP82]MDH6123639.1 CheY-like chemotaxis protein [Kitasatospora sp. GP82]